jgi:predicted nucleotidyltransferase
MDYFRTNQPKIDAQIERFIDFAINFFKLEIVSIYLIGSYIDNSAIPSSDLDIAIVYKNEKPGEIDKISKFFSKASKDLFKTEIDLYLISVKHIKNLDPVQLLTREAVINVKIASQLIYGSDIRDLIHLPDSSAYINLTINTPFHFISKIRGFAQPFDKNKFLEFPDPADYYYGYLSFVDKNNESTKSKLVLSLIGWICTCLVAIKSEQMIGKKSDVYKNYKKYVNDKWTPYVEQAYRFIRQELEYKLPQQERHKKEMRDLCFKLLKFERNFIKEYEQFNSKKT